MTRALIIGDVHLADRAPSSRRDTYTEEVLAKLAWCVERANLESLPIVQAGDLFHIKSPSRNSHALVQRTWEVLRKANNGVWVVPGNHDLYADRLDSLAKQPLGTLAKMPGICLLQGFDWDLCDGKIFGLPYLSEFDGGDWRAAIKPWKRALREGCTGSVDLLVTHAPLFPPGKEPGVYASISPHHWATEWSGYADATYYGHIHDKHGCYSAKPSTYAGKEHLFGNMGAISRGSLHEETVKRWPSVTLYDTTSVKTFGEQPLPKEVVRPPEEVFLFAEKAEEKAKKSSAEEFAAAIGSVQLANLTPEEVVADIKKQGPRPLTMKVIEETIELASAR